MGAITHVGNRLLVLRGKWRGWTGEIIEIKHLPGGLFDYVMRFGETEDDPGSTDVIPADDCREYNPGSINLENPFDITNYLSVNQMKDVAKSIYSTKIVEYLDDIFNRRIDVGCGNIPIQVLNEVINQYAGKMVDQYKDDMLNIFKKVINSDDTSKSNGDDEECFARAIKWALERCAVNYIETHPEEIQNIMKDKIHDSARMLIEEKLSYSINSAIKKTADEVINKAFNIKSDN